MLTPSCPKLQAPSSLLFTSAITNSFKFVIENRSFDAEYYRVLVFRPSANRYMNVSADNLNPNMYVKRSFGNHQIFIMILDSFCFWNSLKRTILTPLPARPVSATSRSEFAFCGLFYYSLSVGNLIILVNPSKYGSEYLTEKLHVVG